MEILVVKVRDGTKKKLRRLGGNVSELVREQIDRLFEERAKGTVHERASQLCGVIKGGRRDVATSREYLKQYAQKRAA